MEDLTAPEQGIHMACDHLIRLGDRYRIADGNLRVALGLYQEALTLALSAFDLQREAEVLTLIGLARLRLGMDGVEDYLLRAYDVAKGCKIDGKLH